MDFHRRLDIHPAHLGGCHSSGCDVEVHTSMCGLAGLSFTCKLIPASMPPARWRDRLADTSIQPLRESGR